MFLGWVSCQMHYSRCVTRRLRVASLTASDNLGATMTVGHATAAHRAGGVFIRIQLDAGDGILVL